MLVNIASVDNGLPKGEPGSLLFRHPEYTRRWWWWEFGRVSYLGGREYHNPTQLKVQFEEPTFEQDANGLTIAGATNKTTAYKALLYRHNREKSWEFQNRKQRAYYNNFPRTIVNAIVSHALKEDPERKGDELLDKFWKGVDYKRKTTIGVFMRNGLRWAQVEGIMWACVDAPKDPGGIPYTYWVPPLDILDWEVDGEGELVWLKQFVYATKTRSWNEPVEPRFRFRIWTRTDVTTWETDVTGGNKVLVPDQTRTHGLGKVPFVPLFSIRNEDYDFPDGTPLAGDLCKAANHIYNLGSLLSEIGYKQTFSWLVVPDKNVDVLQAGLNTAFGYDASAGGEPKYISPDADQARVLMEMIRDAITQARQAMGVGRGRGEESQQQASGDALQVETEDKRSILGDVATEAQDFEVRLAEMVQLYKNPGAQRVAKVETTIRYTMNFDLRSFETEVNNALSLSKFKLSPEVNLEMVQGLVRRHFSGMDPKRAKELADSIKATYEEAEAARKEAEKAAAAGMAATAAKGMAGGDGGEPGDGPGGAGAGDSEDDPPGDQASAA